MSISSADARRHLARMGVAGKSIGLPPTANPPGKPRQMNRWEKAYATQLDLDRESVSWWAYESVQLRLAHRCTYTPDFAAVRHGRLEFIEVKGFRRDDAIVKFKCAAELFRWARFLMVEKKADGWRTIYEFNQ